MVITDDFIKVPASRHSLHTCREFAPSALPAVSSFVRFRFPAFCGADCIPRSSPHPTPPGQIAPDEWNLLYVAATRARTTLLISNSVRRLLTLAGVRRGELFRANSALESHLHRASFWKMPFLIQCFLLESPRS